MSYNKYVIYKKQVSTDDGKTWVDSYPLETSYSGSPLGEYETLEECQESSDYRYMEIDSSGNVVSAMCTSCGFSTLTDGNVEIISSAENPVHLYIGDCITDVDFQENATVHYISGITFSRRVENINAIVGFRYYPNITQTLTIPKTVKTISNGSAYYDDHGFGGVENIVFESGSQLEIIGDFFMRNNGYITNITIPNTVKRIGNNAFQSCSGLTSIVIPDSVEEIGDYAFSGCTSLTSVTIGNGVKKIGYGTFMGCSSLTTVNIPSSVEEIGLYAFNGCTSLPHDDIWYYADTYIFRVITNKNSLKVPYVPTIPNNIKFLGTSALSMKNSELDWSNFKIPSSVKYLNSDCRGTTAFITDSENGVNYVDTLSTNRSSTAVTSVSIREGTRFFSHIDNPINMTSLTLPNTVEIMMDNYPYRYPISSITIPNSVKLIGASAFENCSGLTTVSIGNGVKKIGGSAFKGCSGLTNITIPDSVEEIGDVSFSGCTSLTSLTIGNGVKKIGNSAFRSCSGLTSIVIPDSVEEIQDRAFQDCTGLTSVTIGSSVTSIGEYAFLSGTQITHLTIGDNVKTIGRNAFSNCYKLTSVTIPDNVELIGSGAFGSCSGLTTVSIGSGVKFIAGAALTTRSTHCDFYLRSSCPPTLESTLNYGNCTIYVPSQYLNYYLLDEGWGQYSDKIQTYEL